MTEKAGYGPPRSEEIGKNGKEIDQSQIDIDDHGQPKGQALQPVFPLLSTTKKEKYS